MRNIICCCHITIKKLNDLFVVKMILSILLYDCYVTTINQNFKLEIYILKKQSFLQTLKYLNIYYKNIYISFTFKQYKDILKLSLIYFPHSSKTNNFFHLNESLFLSIFICCLEEMPFLIITINKTRMKKKINTN